MDRWGLACEDRTGEMYPADHPVKLTALIYLFEALVSEQYELCEDCIDIAYEFGASDEEIEGLLHRSTVRMSENVAAR